MNHYSNVQESEIVEKAQERTDSLDMLIDPSDIDESATNWSDLSKQQIDDEIVECFYHMDDRSNDSRYSDLVHDMSMALLAESLTRAPMSDLAFESEKEALKNGYWPNSMNVMDMQDIAYNQIQCHTFKEDNQRIAEIYKQCEREAIETVDRGIAKGLTPDQFK